mgnify:CR=1 FL=1
MSDYWETSKPPSPSDKHWSCEERAWHARRDCSRERCGYPAIPDHSYDE